MKKYLICLLILLLPFFLLAEDNQEKEETVKEETLLEKLPEARKSLIEEETTWLSYVDFDVYQETLLVRGINVGIGLGANVKYTDNNIGAGVYDNVYYLVSPAFSRYELINETGIHLEWNLANTTPSLSTRLAFDIGYYMQFIQPKKQYDNLFHLMHNGLVITTGIDTSFQIIEGYDIGVGIFYKKTVFPKYDGLDGLSFRITVL